MATGYYILGGVTVAPGDTELTATTYQAPGAATDPVNFANLVGVAGAEGTPAGFALLGPAGQVGLVSHALDATTLRLSKPWVGAAIAGGSAELVLGINALPIGRLATLITQIAAQRPLLKTNNLVEFNGDGAAQAAVQANIGISTFIRTLLDDADAAAARSTLGAQGALGFTAARQLGANQIGFDYDGTGPTMRVDATNLGRLWSAFNAASSLSNPGYQRLPSGLIMQWGIGAYAADVALTFPIAFPVACFAVIPMVTYYDGGAGATICATVDAVLQAGFNLRPRFVSAGVVAMLPGTVEIRWIAMGV